MSGQAEFDAVAAEYKAQHAASIRLSGEDTGYFAQYKAVDARAIAAEMGLAAQDLLDFGSGIGNTVAPLRESFPYARLTCLDVSEQSLALSREQHGPGNAYVHYDGMRLPNDLGPFDLVFTACVFHHIPAEQHVALLSQLREVLRPGGVLILFEHNPLNPLTRHAVNSCPFDANAVLIGGGEMKRRFKAAGFASASLRYRVFFPGPLAFLRQLEKFLAWLPLGAQYSLSARRD